jgi:prepilin-type N-terminal cleavage/methylation domain-containing protein
MKERGFTLVEVLMVVAIIAFLSTAIFSSIGKARKQAVTANQNASAAEYISAINLYAANNNFTYPIVPDDFPAGGPYGQGFGEACVGEGQTIGCSFGHGVAATPVVNDQLRPYLSKMPASNVDFVVNPMGIGGYPVTLTGYIYQCYKFAGPDTCTEASFQWVVYGHSCGQAEQAYYNGVTDISQCIHVFH